MDWCITTDHQNPIADNPYSMFEGIYNLYYKIKINLFSLEDRNVLKIYILYIEYKQWMY